MNTTRRNRITAIVGVLGLAASLPVSADIIYSNAFNDIGMRFEPGNGTQVGDEILLAGTARRLTGFSFEYWGTNYANTANTGWSGTPAVQVRFYRNNGSSYNGYNMPGTLLWDSGVINFATYGILPSQRSTLNFGPSDFTGGFVDLSSVASNFTWSVTFIGLGITDHLGLDLYNPPTVGASYPDYWQYNGVSWQLLTNSAPVNFGAVFVAAAVPEPSSVLLGLFGAGGMALALRRRNRA